MPKENKISSYKVGEKIELTFREGCIPKGFSGTKLEGKLDIVLNVEGASEVPSIYVGGWFYDISDFQEYIQAYDKDIVVEKEVA